MARSGVDALETYLRYDDAGAHDLSWSVKAGAFFPTISLENDDIGWASPYTLTPSAINSWIGDEMRTIGKLKFAFIEGPDKIRIEVIEGHAQKE